MYTITYEPIENIIDEINETELSFENMKMAESVFNLQLFLGAQQGYFKANPNNTFQDLENELRRRNFNTHLIAKNPINKLDTNMYKLGMPEKKDDNKIYKYECITSCRPNEHALNELLQTWNSYKENFEALSHAGNIIICSEPNILNLKSEIESAGETLSLTKKNDPIHSITQNKVRVNIVKKTYEEMINEIFENIRRTTGKEPILYFYGMTNTGNQIFGIGVDNKILSNVGIVYQSNGEIQLINL